MTVESISALVVAIAAVATLAMKLHDKHPQLLKVIVVSIANSIPFGFIGINLPLAIGLFTVARIYDLHKDSLMPNLTAHDIFLSLKVLCLNAGLFAITAILIRFRS